MGTYFFGSVDWKNGAHIKEGCKLLEADYSGGPYCAYKMIGPSIQ